MTSVCHECEPVFSGHMRWECGSFAVVRCLRDKHTELTEKVAESIIPNEKCATYVLQPEGGADDPEANILNEKELAPIGCNGGGGIRTPVP